MEKEEMKKLLDGCIENLVSLQILSDTNQRSVINYGKALEPVIISIEKVINDLNCY